MSKKIKDRSLKIFYVSVSELKEALYNARKWSEKMIEELKQSIIKFGFIDPIIVNCAPNRKNIVIGGHFRLFVARLLGFKTVPVVYINIPDEKKEKEINLRLNHAVGTWDPDLLKKIEIDLLLDVGFEDLELHEIWNDVLETEEDDWNIEQEIAKIKKPKTRPGDIYQLGPHRIACMDSTDPESLKKLFDDEVASMIFSDPIYNVKLNYNLGVGGKSNYGGQVDDCKTDAEYKEFLKKSLDAALAVSKKDLHVFYFCDQNYVGTVQNIFKEAGLENKRTCLWVKNGFNVTDKIAFNKGYEACPYSIRGKPYLSPINNLNEILNKEVGSGNRTIDDILDLLDIWLCKRLPGQQYIHPTMKPVTLYEKAIRRCSKPNDIICDSFLGSGSSLIAAEELHRRLYGCEIQEIFCDLIIKRYEQLTGDKAKKIN